jgi:ElaB/YqjD/DUF883 family membrane-anchored ribosome-binding protein
MHMAPTDAEMPDHKDLSEDLEEITQHLANIRAEVDSLVRAIGSTGTHQAGALRAQANEAVRGVEDAVRREPLKSLAIAIGIGFLVGIFLRR